MSSLEEPPLERPDKKDESVQNTFPSQHKKKKMDYTCPEKPRFYEHSFMASAEPEKT